MTVADIGCAEGDCTDFLARRYPSSKFTGIDFSVAGIKKAKQYYPDIDFIRADIRSFNDMFDVVYSSNTLEHFHDPFSMLSHLFKCAKKYVVLLIPFQERQRFEEHFYTFEYRDFLLNNEEFSLVYSREYDCSKIENIFWGGKQLLVIYERGKNADRSVTLDDFVGSLSEEYNAQITKIIENKHELQELKKNNELLLQSTTQSLELLKAKEALIQELNGLLSNEQHRNNELTQSNRELQYQLHGEKENNIYLKAQEDWFRAESYKLSHEIKNIYSSGFWKLASKYYRIRDNFPGIKHLFKAARIIKNHGFRDFYRLCKLKICNFRVKNTDPAQVNEINSMYSRITQLYQENHINGIAVIPAAFPFDELYNQRSINLAKYLSGKKIISLFIIWQWDKNEIVERAYEEVFPFVYSIPMSSFFENIDRVSNLREITNKYAFLNIPSSSYVGIIPNLRNNGFEIVYDIMDEWEEFAKVGQAPWYDKFAEESMILQADRVTAVSQALVEKFSFIRCDIQCIGNGYFPELLGSPNISSKKQNENEVIQVGYFGHLTESWFDWELIFELAKNETLKFHLIGYGASQETLRKIKKYKNIKYHGKVKPSELNDFVSNWNVAIIPFSQSKLSEAVDPIKVYEYLYFGLPVVVTGIPHLRNYPLVRVVNNEAGDFMKAIEASYSEIGTTTSDNDRLPKFLRDTTWESRFDKLMGHENSGYVRLYRK